MASIMTSDDVKDMRKRHSFDLGFATDEQLIEAFDGENGIVWKARQWGWNDTEVREDSVIALEKFFGVDDIMELVYPESGPRVKAPKSEEVYNVKKIDEPSADVVQSLTAPVVPVFPVDSAGFDSYTLTIENKGVTFGVTVYLADNLKRTDAQRDDILMSKAISEIERSLSDLKQRHNPRKVGF